MRLKYLKKGKSHVTWLVKMSQVTWVQNGKRVKNLLIGFIGSSLCVIKMDLEAFSLSNGSISVIHGFLYSLHEILSGTNTL